MPLFLCFPELAPLGEKLLRQKWSQGQSCIPTHSAQQQVKEKYQFMLANRSDQGFLLDECLQGFWSQSVKKHLGSNYRSIVPINKAVTFTSLPINSINYH